MFRNSRPLLASPVKRPPGPGPVYAHAPLRAAGGRSDPAEAGSLDLRLHQGFVHHGKGAKDRVVYLSDDAYEALGRPASRVKEVFLVDKGRCRVMSDNCLLFLVRIYSPARFTVTKS